ncbi:MAG: transcription antitermination factor NusB [Candidatus Gallimonas sp.]
MRSDARETAFKIIFAEQFNKEYDERFRALEYGKLKEEDRAFALRLVRLVEENEESLSARLNERVERFAEYRIYPADRAILLIAMAEIEYCDDIPPVVSVSEAAGLARKFSTEKSANFVNGVLAGVINA